MKLLQSLQESHVSILKTGMNPTDRREDFDQKIPALQNLCELEMHPQMYKGVARRKNFQWLHI